MTDDTLPGLERATPGPNQLRAAIERTISRLEADGLIGEADAAKVELARELCTIIADKRARGRTSTVAMDARVLLDLLAAFDERAAVIDGPLEAAMAAWSAELAKRAALPALEAGNESS